MSTPLSHRIRGRLPHALQPSVRAVYRAVGPATAALRMRPGFIVIGGQRCGTTTIFKTLADHPQVVRPPVVKGTDFYTLHHARGARWYRSQFPLAGVADLTRAQPAVAFEACTYYLFHPLAIERIAAEMPQVRLVAMLRDPVERAWSAYKHELARGFETITDFEDALEAEDGRLAGEVERMVADPTYNSFAHRHHAYLRRGQYAEQIARVLEHFPREQLHVMDSESFFADPAGEWGRLVEFLGLRPWSPAVFEQHNARPSASMPPGARERLERHYADHDARLADVLGRAPGWARATVRGG